MSLSLPSLCQNHSLSLRERVGVREFGGAGLPGSPHPAFGHPLPKGEGFDAAWSAGMTKSK